MITKTNSLNNINEITLTNLENGEVTLEQLNEVYNKWDLYLLQTKVDSLNKKRNKTLIIYIRPSLWLGFKI